VRQHDQPKQLIVEPIVGYFWVIIKVLWLLCVILRVVEVGSVGWAGVERAANEVGQIQATALNST
jgi:hypothetical protein